MGQVLASRWSFVVLHLASSLADIYGVPVEGACSSPNPGDSRTATCQEWCSVADKHFDCGFCMCKACAMCSGSSNAATASALATSTLSSSSSAEVEVLRSACALGASSKLVMSWASGFRMHVTVNTWTPGASFSVNFPESQGQPPLIKNAFGADVANTDGDGSITLTLKRTADEDHGFGFIAQGVYSPPIITCGGDRSSVLPRAHSPPPSAARPPPPPQPPRPPPYPPLSGHEARQAECRGLAVMLDRSWDGGFAVTATLVPWRANVPIHLELQQAAELTNVFHGSRFASHLNAVTVLTSDRPGQSSSGHQGVQLTFRGTWHGASVSCNSHCLAAAVTISSSVLSRAGAIRLHVVPSLWKVHMSRCPAAPNSLTNN